MRFFDHDDVAKVYEAMAPERSRTAASPSGAAIRTLPELRGARWDHRLELIRSAVFP